MKCYTMPKEPSRSFIAQVIQMNRKDSELRMKNLNDELV